MGTPEFAAAHLQALHTSGHEIAGVVTSVSKPGARGHQLIHSAVKQKGEELGLPILQPHSLKDPAFISTLRSLEAELFVVVAFRMLPEVVWSIPPRGTINIHASLLPAYRGAAPIHWAIIRGEKVTGVTSFLIDREIDTGKILLQKSIAIDPEDTTGTLHDKLMHLGSQCLLETVKCIKNNSCSPVQQDASLVSHAPKIFFSQCEIQGNQSVQSLLNFIRGMNPYPAAWIKVEGKILKIFRSKVYSNSTYTPPGTLLYQPSKWFGIQCQDGILEFTEVQLEGHRKLSAKEFLRGWPTNWSNHFQTSGNI